MRPRLRAATAGLALAATTLTLTACEARPEKDQTPSAQAELAAAFAALDDTSALATGLRVVASDGVVSAIAEEQEVPVDQVRAALKSQLDLTVSTGDGRTLEQAAAVTPDPGAPLAERLSAGDVDLHATVAGYGEVTLRLVDGAVYLRFTGRLADLIGAGAGAPVELPGKPGDLEAFWSAFANEKFVMVPAATLTELLGVVEDNGGADLRSSVDAATIASLTDAVDAATEVVETKDDATYVATVQVKDLLDGLAAAAPTSGPMAGSLPQLRAEDLVVDEDLTMQVEVSVAAGVVTGVRVDLSQFMSLLDKAKVAAGGEELALVVTFDTAAAPVTAPAGAVSADPVLQPLLGLADRR